MKNERINKKTICYLIAVVSAFLKKKGYASCEHRNGNILYLYVSGKSLEEIGKAHGITPARVRQIVDRETRQLAGCIESEGYFRMCEKYHNLKQNYDILKAQYGFLKETARRLCQYVPMESKAVAALTEKRALPQILTKRVVDIGISNRALNCLKAAGVEYLWQLVQYRRTDLFKYRNFGKRSFGELDDILKKYGLSWEEDLTGYVLPEE